ncbi:MAG: DUF481 domain-containing protein [Acidobacteriia bacterium]|nr:DUF481 domain-containing protein [Terriglobia bacterium]
MVLVCLESASGQASRDELMLADGERLLGHLERSDDKALTFKSEALGEITVEWSKVEQFHSASEFAVVPKGIRFGRHEDTSKIPQGNVSVEHQSIHVTEGPAGSQNLAVGSTGYVIDEARFQKSLRRPGLFEGWNGTATAGVSLVLATQNNRTYTSAVAFTRAIPTEPWMDPENRTVLSFSSSYGELTAPGQPLSKTSILHADAEWDEYFTRRLYSFVQAAFDHNFSQGLDLEQTYGTGLGWTVVKGDNEQFDLKAELTYVNQRFQSSAQDQMLVGSVFSEGYDHVFKHGVMLREALSISPAWNNTRAYSTTGNVLLTFPISKRFSISLNALDTFLNDPSPGFKKNSFQYTTGLTYAWPRHNQSAPERNGGPQP